MEIFPRHDGILCGMEEVKALLAEVLPEDKREVWALAEGEAMKAKEVALRITAPYRSYGVYETAILGMLAHGSGWATAARECVRAAAGMTFRVPVLKARAREVLELLRAAGVPLLVADAAGRDVGDARTVGGWALVVGSEGSGPRTELMDAAAHTVRIPMPGPAESLNAGVAGAILLYALTREETVAH